MIQYSLEVGICWAILYLVYLIFLRKETFFSINRWYLLVSLLVGLLIPLVRFIPISFHNEAVLVQESLYFISAGPELIATSVQYDNLQGATLFTLQNVLMVLYLIGILIVGFRFVTGLYKISRLYTKGKKFDKGSFTLIETNKVHLPFSFLNCVFFSKELPINDGIEKILKHELTHVKSWHTLDVLFLEVLHVIFWFNPLIILYKNAIKESHEYVADASVLHDTSQKIYGQILLRQSQSGLQIALANHFFHSHIKKRLTMMKQKKSKRPAMIKYLMAVPAILLLSMLFQSQTLPQIPIPDNLDGIAMEMVIPKTNSNEFIIPTPDDNIIHRSSDFGERLHPIFKKDDLNNIGVNNNTPLFPGCSNKDCSKKKLEQYIYKHLIYPQTSKDQGIQGLNIAKVEVDKDGKMTDIELIRSIDNETGQATLKLLQKMQEDIEWIPAKDGANTILSSMIITVKFELGGDIPYNDSYSTMTIEKPELPGLYLHQNVGPKIFYSYYSEDNAPVEFVLQDENGKVINTHKVESHKPREFTGFFDVKNSVNTSYTISAKQSGSSLSKMTKPFKKELKKEIRNNDGACKADETGKYYWVERRPGLKSCNGNSDNDAFLDCSKDKIYAYFADNLKYPEEGIKEGFQGHLTWMLTIDEHGKIINAEIPKNLKPYKYGYMEEGERVIKNIIEEFEFVPAQCDGKNVKSWYPISYRVILDDNQKQQVAVRNKSTVKNVFQNLHMSNASSDGNLGFSYESNLNVPFTVEILNPDGESVYKLEKDYMYKRYGDWFKLDNPVNGIYTAVVMQDGVRAESKMDINVFKG